MRVIRLAALIATAQVALVIILFTFGYSVAHAATIYSQPDDTGAMGINASFGRIVSAPITYIGANYLTSDGVPIYIQVWIKSTGNFTTSAQLMLNSVGGQCGTYMFNSGDVATLGDGLYHLFSVATNWNNNASICHSNTSGDITLYSAGTGTTMKANGANTIQFAMITSAPYIAPPANGVAFEMLLPALGTTTPTTSVEFKAQYYVASTTIEATAGHGGFGLSSTKYYLNLTRLDVASTSQWFIANGAGNDQWNTLDQTIVLTASSTWRGVWTSYDSASPYPTYQRSAYFNFSVQSNTLLSSLGIAGYETIPSLSSASTTAIAPAPCSILDVSGCFQNALVFLFYPSTASLDQYSTLWTTIKNKPPFGYVVAVQTAVGTLSASSTATFNLGTVPFMTAIFDPFRTAVAVLMWLVFIVAFYHRLSTLDI
jgi:hypothetical protein